MRFPVALLTAGLLCLSGLAQSDRHAALAERVDRAACAQALAQDLVGLAWGIVVPGQPIHANGYGYENRKAGVLVSSRTLFRWASISKPLTAVAAMQLVESKKLDLDQDARVLVPEFPQKPHEVHARHLLAHQGGIVHYSNGPVLRSEVDYKDPWPFTDVVVALDTFKRSPLLFQPGTRYAYTTHGYILLGALVQRAGEQSYWAQVRERIAKPLGMESLQPDYPFEELAHRACGYRRSQGVIVESLDRDVSWKLPGGGFVSNIEDLARFAQGLLGDTLIKPSTKSIMWTRQPLPNDKRSSYGLGFFVGTAYGQELISHSGAQEKTRTLMRLLPESDLGIVLMTNCEYASLRPIAQAIESVLLSEDETP